jgi:hypothetical protein
MQLTDWGAHAAQQGENERYALLNELIGGSAEVMTYTTGVCYDTVAFCMFLGGRVDVDSLLSVTGDGWTSLLGFDGGTVWQGEGIPAGSAVGFKRVGESYFHAAVGVGGTTVRGVNGFLLSPGWSVPADIAEVLAPTETAGQYMYDGRAIEVHYV